MTNTPTNTTPPKLTDQDRIYFIGWLSGSMDYIYSLAYHEKMDIPSKIDILNTMLNIMSQPKLSNKEIFDIFLNTGSRLSQIVTLTDDAGIFDTKVAEAQREIAELQRGKNNNNADL